MAAYYNEYDPKAAAWLRELIKQGHIADGVVDDRSIEDVRPTELAGFTQCHFFAGIGVWSYALRRAGWADDRAVWTGSCPCQPFSAAGKGAGFDDERHLWPAFHHLISQCQPPIVLGEQVASKDGLAWLDLVCADLEATGYASGAVDLCAAGVGAPHIRQRLWWVGTRLADTTNNAGIERCELHLQRGWQDNSEQNGLGCKPDNMADTDNAGSQGRVSGRSDQGREDQLGHGGRGSAVGGVANAENLGRFQRKVGYEGGSKQPIGSGREYKGMRISSPSGASGDVGLADATILRRGEGRPHDGGLRGGNSAEGQVGRSAINSDVGNGLADTSGIGWQRGQGSTGWREHDGQDAGWQQGDDGAVRDNETGAVGVADTDDAVASGQLRLHTQDGSSMRQGDSWSQSEFASGVERPSPTNGHWKDADWLFCSDGKWRPVEPGTFPLAHGAAARVGRLRGYGNAIVAQAAQAFIESVMGE